MENTSDRHAFLLRRAEHGDDFAAHFLEYLFVGKAHYHVVEPIMHRQPFSYILEIPELVGPGIAEQGGGGGYTQLGLLLAPSSVCKWPLRQVV